MHAGDTIVILIKKVLVLLPYLHIYFGDLKFIKGYKITPTRMHP